jgi:predicted XRE-type DNA-binding protein
METIEEAAKNYAENELKNRGSKNDKLICMIDFSAGANWMAERMYSEDEVKEIIKLSCEEGMFIQRTINDKVNIPYTRIKDFTIKMFEQFKKK